MYQQEISALTMNPMNEAIHPRSETWFGLMLVLAVLAGAVQTWVV